MFVIVVQHKMLSLWNVLDIVLNRTLVRVEINHTGISAWMLLDLNGIQIHRGCTDIMFT